MLRKRIGANEFVDNTESSLGNEMKNFGLTLARNWQ